MQAAKDSFYMALRERLKALNPARTMVIDGVTVPAIMVRENMEPRFGEAQPGAFYVVCWRRWMLNYLESATRRTPKCSITARFRALTWDREFSGRCP